MKSISKGSTRQPSSHPWRPAHLKWPLKSLKKPSDFFVLDHYDREFDIGCYTFLYRHDYNGLGEAMSMLQEVFERAGIHSFMVGPKLKHRRKRHRYVVDLDAWELSILGVEVYCHD